MRASSEPGSQIVTLTQQWSRTVFGVVLMDMVEVVWCDEVVVAEERCSQ